MGIFKKGTIPLKLITKSTLQKEQRSAHFPEHAVQNSLRLILHNKSLQKTRVRITNWKNFISRRGKHFHKIGKGRFGLLQSGARYVIMWGRWFITRWGNRCYKMGQLFSKVNQVLQSGTRANRNWISNFLQLFSIVIANGGGIKKWDSVITKWDNYFKESK